ncbi:MAG: hydroxyacid dehydrogenase [Corynebacteriales bacterium]|nr:hydroxyacid dehydrogenase [Mycobacteriales bacterium]
MRPKIAFAPDEIKAAARGEDSLAQNERLLEAVKRAGGDVVSLEEANGLVWLEVGDAKPLSGLLDAYPNISWVQLPWAGVDSFVAGGLFDHPAQFTCAKASYGEQVGEHALVLALAALRNLTAQARRPHWHMLEPESLFRKRVTILGAGGIATTLIALLQPFGCDITVVRRTAESTPGANRTVGQAELDSILPDTDVLVLALALTPATTGIIGEKQLALLPDNAVLVNVARGAHVDTDALVTALTTGQIAAAGLDVTYPEPLPAAHPLWTLDNVTITSHCADSLEFVSHKLAERVADNVAALVAGTPLLGLVDKHAGY